MPKFYSLEQPSKEGREILTKLEKYPKIKPQLTFLFTLNEKRRNALEMIKTGKIDEKKVTDLLKSDDFVEKMAGIYLLNKTNLLEEKKQIILPLLEELSKDEYGDVRKAVAQTLGNLGEKALPLLEELSKDEEFYVRKAAIQALGNLGEKALPLLEELSKDEYKYVRETVAQTLGNLGEKALPLLEELSEDEYRDVRKEAVQSKIKIIVESKGEHSLPLLEELSKNKKWYVRKAVAQTLGNLGEKALPLLEELSKDEYDDVRETVAQTLGNLGEKALPLLEELSKNKKWYVRKAVVQTLENLGEKALPLLKELSKDEDWHVRKAVAQALGNLGEKALPLLEELSKDEYGDVRETVAQALGNLGEKALPLLEELSKDEKWYVRKEAKQVIMRTKGGEYKYLLSTQKPLFATPETELLAKRIKVLEEIAQKLKDKFGDKFIGITIFGSTAKGYFIGESDLDWGIIAKDKSVSEEFKRMAAKESFELCKEHYVGIGGENKILENKDVLFCGLFFGDYKELRKLQKTALQDMDKKEWDRIRSQIMKNEIHLFKAAFRFNIQEEEMEKIKQFVALLRVPPSYDEAIEIVEKRTEKKENRS